MVLLPLFLRQQFFALEVFAKSLGDHLEEYFACMRHEKNAEVVPTICLISFIVDRHDGGIFPWLRNFPFAVVDRDQALDLPKDGPVLAQSKFPTFGRKPVRPHCFRLDHRLERYCNRYLRWFYPEIRLGGLL